MSRPILCFGEALIDFHAEGVGPAGFPRAFVPFAGGAPANVAVAAARLGGTARFAGMLSTDPFGDFLLDSLERAGVGVADVARTGDANTALAFVSLDARGERSFNFYRPPSADLLFRPWDFRAQAFDDIAVFHVCSNSMTDPELAETTREGMRRAQAAGALVSFDLNLRPALWPRESNPRPSVWPALHLADVVKLCAEEFAWLAQDGALLDRLWQGRTRLLVVTDGPRPLLWYRRDGSGELPCPQVEAVDTTAAGDAFVGGLLCQLASLEAGGFDALLRDGAALHGLLAFAAACGALTVTRQGSFTAMPSAAEVHAFLESNR
jgi:fructokinase